MLGAGEPQLGEVFGMGTMFEGTGYLLGEKIRDRFLRNLDPEK